ncbi:patatin-like phospholipase family protein [Candidatus Neomarinimicrobiota bacterium]
MWRKKNIKVGLALGSGSARGWAHIGAIEAIEEAGIPIHYVAGTSIGAFVGAVYATGDLDSLKQFALQMDWKKVLSYFDVVFPRSGLMDGKKVHELFSIHTKARTFDDFKIPVKIIATDLNTGEKVIIDSGNIIESIRASLSVPGVFTPVNLNNKWLVDGGLVDPVPVKVVREMGADIVIGIDLNSRLSNSNFPKKIKKPDKAKPSLKERNELIARISAQYGNAEKAVKKQISRWYTPSSRPNILDVLGSSIGIMEEQITRINLAMDPPDILIQPRLGNLKMFDFDQAEQSIQEGYTQAKYQIENIKALL